MENNIYAKIIVDISSNAVDKAFLYKIPTELIDVLNVGDKVVIPFGKSNKMIEGFIISINTEKEIIESKKYSNDEYLKNITDFSNIKNIIKKADKKFSINNVLMSMAMYMSEEYMCPLSLCLKTVLPINRELRKNSKRVDVIENYNINNNLDIKLNDEQKNIVDILKKFYKQNRYSNHLIYGITGSGKTEVYIKLIEEVIKDNKKVIVLIPEISLTYQTVIRLKQKFDKNISIIHSKMTEGEKYLQIQKCMNGEVDILVGPRSALFAPFENLGLIVMDEEDDHSYKSDMSPRYHARDMAIYRAKLQNAMFVSLSATPNITSYTNALNNIKDKNNCELDDKEFHLYKLTNRAVKDLTLPKVYIVDLCKEFKLGNKTIFSKLLVEKINDRLSKNEQVMLFMNRRGLNKVVTCVECGKNFKCPNCDVSLTLHNDGKMRCHYCGYEQKQVLICPDCGSKKFTTFGIGTQKLEQETLKYFNSARILRMDRDTTKEKNGYDKIIEKFKNHEADILLGTQMIVKGHDFNNVTLVGVICADMSFNVQNYKATEDAFSLLMQVSGRSGRSKYGECVVQTYDAGNVILDLLKDADYEKFYNYEINFRKSFKYPPFTNLIVASFRDVDKYVLADACKYIKSIILKEYKVELLGPMAPVPAKISNYYYKNIYIKVDDYDLAKQIRYKMYELLRNNAKYKTVLIAFDIEK